MSVNYAAAGLGLQYGEVRLVRAKDEWAPIADELVAAIRSELADVASAVAHIGSTAVPGLLAKPVIDIAIAVRPGVGVDDVSGPMARLGWLYRGDAGQDGGWVFVLEDAPWHRVAHAHGVESGGEQWRRYLQLRELLRSSPEARRTYEATKLRLADQHPEGHREYTAGKTGTVQQLLADRA